MKKDIILNLIKNSEHKKLKESEEYYFITLNNSTEKDMTDILLYIKNCMSKKLITNVIIFDTETKQLLYSTICYNDLIFHHETNVEKNPQEAKSYALEKLVFEYSVKLKEEDIAMILIKNKISISTMESCTSGLLASTITDTEGASDIFKGAFVTYSNEAKVMQGVNQEIINMYGVYSSETAVSMARACKEAYNANIGIGVTGSAGNVDENNKDSVPGEVYFSIIFDDKIYNSKIILNEKYPRPIFKEYVVNKIIQYLKTFLINND